MEFSSFLSCLLFLGQIFQFSNTIVSFAKVEIPAQNGPTDRLDILIEPSYDSFTPTFNNSHPTDVDIGQRLVQQRIKRDTDDDKADDTDYYTAEEGTEDVVFIDHREHCCLDEPRSQGGCDASYAFATIAFYEWLYRQQNLEYEYFSEQYIIDCGFAHGMSGCSGGHPADAMRFVRDCGLVLRKYYRYTETQGICPSNLIDLGHQYISKPSLTDIPLDQQSLEDHLRYGPIIVIIEIGNGFLSYRGGVDDNVGHSPDHMHAMLLIGHGREDDKDYWLFRNSRFDPSIGDGLYKLNKNVDCLWDGIGLSQPLEW